MKKITIGNESSSNLNAHSIGNADGELWLWGPQINSYGEQEWGINEGRNGSCYSIATYWSRKEARHDLLQMRRERAEQVEGAPTS
jgi:hypothetical protein